MEGEKRLRGAKATEVEQKHEATHEELTATGFPVDFDWNPNSQKIWFVAHPAVHLDPETEARIVHSSGALRSGPFSTESGRQDLHGAA